MTHTHTAQYLVELRGELGVGGVGADDGEGVVHAGLEEGLGAGGFVNGEGEEGVADLHETVGDRVFVIQRDGLRQLLREGGAQLRPGLTAGGCKRTEQGNRAGERKDGRAWGGCVGGMGGAECGTRGGEEAGKGS